MRYLCDEFDGCASTSMSEDSLFVHNVLLLCHLHLVGWQMGGVAFDVIRTDRSVHTKNAILHILHTRLVPAVQCIQ